MYKFSRKHNSYILNWDLKIIVGEKYVQSIKNFPNELELISNINCPTQICYADSKHAALKKAAHRYYKYAKEPKELVGIKGAGHCFIEGETGNKLYEKTANWFLKHI